MLLAVFGVTAVIAVGVTAYMMFPKSGPNKNLKNTQVDEGSHDPSPEDEYWYVCSIGFQHVS